MRTAGVAREADEAEIFVQAPMQAPMQRGRVAQAVCCCPDERE